MTIPVTKPFLPPFSAYQQMLEGIWQREWLTNHGPLVTRLEKELAAFLDINTLFYVSNGTIALQIAIKALELRGKVITTPFSYVATTSTLCWEGCQPVMADIDEKSLNISPASIEALIDDETTGIVATHVYGNPCDVEAIQRIAEKHKLKVIYDGAHAFGTKYKGKSIFEFGHLSTTSFHATKLFHTVEGGAVFGADSEALSRVAYLRNFGHTSATSFGAVGVNGKNSEIHAAMGLSNLAFIDEILKRRKELCELYDSLLEGTNIWRPAILKGTQYNHAYFPVVLRTEKACLQALDRLQQYSIYPRRYFYPSLSELNYVNQGHLTPICNDISARVICLPLYHTLSNDEVELVARVLRESLEA